MPSLPLLFYPGILNPASRLKINTGVQQANQHSDYIDGAIIPLQTFSTIGAETLTNQPSIIGKNFIAVVDCRSFIFPLTQLGIPLSATAAELANFIKTPVYTNFLLEAANSWPKAICSDGPFQILGVSFKHSQQETATVDQKLGKRIGLHLDSWDRGALDQREKNRNRLCINLGSEDRYLLFVNKPIVEMLNDLNADPVKIGGSDLGRSYLKKYPDTPVAQLTIQPGEAYIAPTENIIHDSTTLDKTKPDLALTFLGHFYLNPDLDPNFSQ